MSNYTKATQFAPKDNLPQGDPNKIVLGAEIDAEFDAIEVAVNTKIDTLNASQAGALLTADVSGQISDSKLAALDAHHPVNSLYLSTSSDNPAAIFGAGTWALFSQGRVIVGAGGSFPDGSTGGSSTTTLTTNNLPQHVQSVTVNSGSNFERNGGDTAVDSVTVNLAGSSIPANNMQPYIVAYIWQRTA